MDVVRNTEDAYWGLIAAQDSTHVAEKSLETAKALLQQTQAQYEVGVVSHVEVVQAEAGVADREFSLIRAQAVERNAQDALIDVVLGPYLEPETEIKVEPTDRPEERTLARGQRGRGDRARDGAPPRAAARAQGDRAPHDRHQGGEQQAPAAARRDRATTASRDLAGRVNPDCVDFTSGVPCTDPPGVRPNFDDSDHDLFNGDGAESYGVAGVLSIPLGNNTARHEYAKAELELRRAKTALRAPRAVDRERDPARGAQSGGVVRGHRSGRARARPPLPSSCAPSACDSNTASRRPSTCCCARRIWSAPRARRSSPSRPITTPLQLSIARRGRSSSGIRSSSIRPRRCGRLRALRTGEA